MDFSTIFSTGSWFKRILGPLGVILFLRLLPAILQGSSTFGSKWIKEDICSSMKPEPFCCSNHSCGSQYQLQDIDKVFFIIQVISFVLLLMPLICCDCCVYCIEDKGCIRGITVLVIQMIAGVLSLVGCIAIAVKFHGTFSYGDSFLQCLLGGIYVFLLSLVCGFCCDIWGNQDYRERSRLTHYGERSVYESV